MGTSVMTTKAILQRSAALEASRLYLERGAGGNGDV